jgi:hypothetical protein
MSVIDELKELRQLLDQGSITQEEFNLIKKNLLSAELGETDHEEPKEEVKNIEQNTKKVTSDHEIGEEVKTEEIPIDFNDKYYNPERLYACEKCYNVSILPKPEQNYTKITCHNCNAVADNSLKSSPAVADYPIEPTRKPIKFLKWAFIAILFIGITWCVNYSTQDTPIPSGSSGSSTRQNMTCAWCGTSFSSRTWYVNLGHLAGGCTSTSNPDVGWSRYCSRRCCTEAAP